MKYVPPSVHETAFNCPYCDVLTTQTWFLLYADSLPAGRTAGREPWTDGSVYFQKGDGRREGRRLYSLFASQCFDCIGISVWIDSKIVHPQRGEAPPANPDLPEDIRRDYDEASSILDLSPRGAAALLRLALQKLCKELGQSGENINDDIKALVKGGLDPVIQQAFDSIRVVGNKAVHPGEIDLREEPGTAEKLFGILNLIAEAMISVPKHVKEFYEDLPKKELEKIEKRDGGT